MRYRALLLALALVPAMPSSAAFGNTTIECAVAIMTEGLIDQRAGLGSGGGRRRYRFGTSVVRSLVTSGSTWTLGALAGDLAIVTPRKFTATAGGAALAAWLQQEILEGHLASDLEITSAVLAGEFRTNARGTRVRGVLQSSFVGQFPTELTVGGTRLRLICGV